MFIFIGYMVRIIGLHGRKYWMLGYIVGSVWDTRWGVLGYMVRSLGLHCDSLVMI